tara:strand:+ start:439 stop:984 length:546 start_codon:yes stop_codon:yes gene_type:complete
MRLFGRLREDVRAVIERDPAARNALDVILSTPGVHSLFWHRVAARLWQSGWLLLARIISNASRSAFGIEIHPGARIGRRLVIDHGMGVVIGETSIVGDDCTIYHGVTLGGKETQRREDSVGRRHPSIGNQVKIGAGAKLLGPITVGDNSVVGAQSVVTKDIPAGALAVGIPAKVKRSPKLS